MSNSDKICAKSFALKQITDFFYFQFQGLFSLRYDSVLLGHNCFTIVMNIA